MSHSGTAFTVDHLVYGVSDLSIGIAEIESLLGVRPVLGGRHPGFGTHNALLSLGPATYLEIIAADPGLPVPDQGLPFGLEIDQPSGMATWAIRTEAIDELAQRATTAGINVGAIQHGSRKKFDGTLLSWQLSDPDAMLMDGAIPFLISWGNTPHPARTTPRGGELLEIRVEHPEAVKVRETLTVLGADITVSEADKFTLIASIKTGCGIVELK